MLLFRLSRCSSRDIQNTGTSEISAYPKYSEDSTLEELWSRFMWSFRRVPDQERIVAYSEVIPLWRETTRKRSE